MCVMVHHPQQLRLGKRITGVEAARAMASLADAASVVWPGMRLMLYRPQGSVGVGSHRYSESHQDAYCRVARRTPYRRPFVRAGGLKR